MPNKCPFELPIKIVYTQIYNAVVCNAKGEWLASNLTPAKAEWLKAAIEEKAERDIEHEPHCCPRCGGPTTIDREHPPNAYLCDKCQEVEDAKA